MARTTDVTAPNGKTYKLEEVRGARRMAFLRMLGSENAANPGYAGTALLVLAVKAVDGQAATNPSNLLQIEAAVDVYDDDFGTLNFLASAYQTAFSGTSEAVKDAAKN